MSLVCKLGDQIALVAESDAATPTLQFYFMAFAYPENADGSLQDSMTSPKWREPVEYSPGFIGAGKSAQIVIRATSSAPKQRWTISIPPQEDTHGNYGYYLLKIYAKASE